MTTFLFSDFVKSFLVVLINVLCLFRQGQPCFVNMCDSANLCVNFQAKDTVHRGMSSHDLGYTDPQILSAVHTGVRAQWGEDSLVCYFARVSQSHIPNFQTLFSTSSTAHFSEIFQEIIS